MRHHDRRGLALLYVTYPEALDARFAAIASAIAGLRSDLASHAELAGEEASACLDMAAALANVRARAVALDVVLVELIKAAALASPSLEPGALRAVNLAQQRLSHVSEVQSHDLPPSADAVWLGTLKRLRAALA